MAKQMGELLVKHDGVEYRLCLTNRSIGVLQDEYGRDMAAIMPSDGGVPNFGAIVRAVELSLSRYHSDVASADLADDIVGVDRSVFGDLLAVTFPDVDGGGAVKKPKARVKKTI